MGNNGRTPAGEVALGGVLAALAVVILSLGTLIPGAGYICPILCILLTQVMLHRCGTRIAWAWYGAVAVLGALLAADKESAAVFLFLGYYPILKPWFDGKRLGRLWKLLYFNLAAVVMTLLLEKLLGIPVVEEEFQNIGGILIAVLLLLANVTFLLTDKLLEILPRRFRSGGK